VRRGTPSYGAGVAARGATPPTAGRSGGPARQLDAGAGPGRPDPGRHSLRFIGSSLPALNVLRAATDADELLVTTITHDHTDQVRSYELLARHWYAGGEEIR
jgi:hypothetical protein